MDPPEILLQLICQLLFRVNDINRAHTMPTATPASQFMWFRLPRIWEVFVVPFLCDRKHAAESASVTTFSHKGANMNGFKVLAVGAFLFCGPSFCHAQISILENQAVPRSILVNSGQEDRFQPSAEANLERFGDVDAEISTNAIENPFADTDFSPADAPVDNNIAPETLNDPASLPVGIRHRQNPVDQILRNGLMSQTLNSEQVPVAWPMQSPDNPTARMMMNSGCTQGLWDNYAAERAAQCALMYQRLAGKQAGHRCGKNCKSCGHAGCTPSGSGSGHFKPVNRYAPAACDNSPFSPASYGATQQPQYKNLLEPNPTPAAASTDEPASMDSNDQNKVAQLPGLIR